VIRISQTGVAYKVSKSMPETNIKLQKHRLRWLEAVLNDLSGFKVKKQVRDTKE
jgi:hypothetical protein